MLAVVLAIAMGPVRIDPDTGYSLDTPPVPAAELRPDLMPRAAGTGEILFVNFDGGVLQTGCGNDPHYDCSTLADTFSGYVGPFEGNLQQRISILQATRKDLADFNVQVVVERPPDDVDYTMVFYGDIGPQSFAGVAPYIDCEDRRGGDVSFTGGFTGSNTGSTVILQEAAHTWGLEHVDSEKDILNPFKSGLNQAFQDECFKIVANTELQPTSGSCNQIHQMFCPIGSQNSWREMMYLFGPAIPDTTPPTVSIVSPVQDSFHVMPKRIALVGDVDDDRHPQIYNVKVFALEAPPIKDFDPAMPIYNATMHVTLDLFIDPPEPGEYFLHVIVTDEAGNAGEDFVRFTALPEGSELPEPEEDEPEVPADDTCRVGARGSPSLGVLLLFAAWRRRRAEAPC